ncbi:uncharacterized protein LOC136771403 isoform X2 [Amia ocellicauda]|uniref:uncharacterized protein LOC136771403 isoform X2 n=1 Tax=Amia ocellicauda TaxID=2972642 RepID=UPI003463C7E8
MRPDPTIELWLLVRERERRHHTPALQTRHVRGMDGLRKAPGFLLLSLLSLGTRWQSAAVKYTVTEGGAAVLECKISKPPSHGEPVRWSFSKTGSKPELLLTRDEKGAVRKEVAVQDKRVRLLPDDNKLMISPVRSADSGLYLCNGEHAANLEIKGKQKDTKERSTVKPAMETTPAGGRDSAEHTTIEETFTGKQEVTTQSSTAEAATEMTTADCRNSRCSAGSSVHRVHSSLTACGVAGIMAAVIAR